MAGFEYFLKMMRRQKSVEQQLSELRLRRLVLVWAAQKVDEKIEELEKQSQPARSPGEAPVKLEKEE